ncbi:MAG: DUF1614 domain-containing protein [Bacillota bacterium]
MFRLPVGAITLLIASVLIYFGLAQRLLDRMRLSDRAALLFLGAMLVGSYIPDIQLTPLLGINIGGGLVPLVLALWLWFTADEAKEKWRAALATAIGGTLIYLASTYLPGDPANMVIDPMYLYALLAGFTAYIIGRSRRASFIAGVLSVVANDIAYAIGLAMRGYPGGTVIGGAGMFDTVIIAGLLAVLLAELVGETRERLGGGHKAKIEVPPVVELNAAQKAKIEDISERRDRR